MAAGSSFPPHYSPITEPFLLHDDWDDVGDGDGEDPDGGDDYITISLT